MKASELCPTEHLAAVDLDGKDVVVTITHVDKKKVGPEQVLKGRVHFKEFDRPLVINKTNKDRIVDWFGNDCDKWKDQTITLYPSETDFQGKVVDCIRVRPKK